MVYRGYSVFFNRLGRYWAAVSLERDGLDLRAQTKEELKAAIDNQTTEPLLDPWELPA